MEEQRGCQQHLENGIQTPMPLSAAPATGGVVRQLNTRLVVGDFPPPDGFPFPQNTSMVEGGYSFRARKWRAMVYGFWQTIFLSIPTHVFQRV